MKDISEIDELQMEAKQLIPLNHMNIVSYEDDFIHFESGKLEARYSYILVMEYCNGGDLTDKIRKAADDNQTFTERQLMEYFCQLCLAVKYIHSRDVIHRDIKSPNLFLSDEHYLKVGDFGLSTKGRSVKGKSRFSVVGTDCYMAPEVRDGRHIDNNTNPSLKPSDVWCIGLILMELITLIPVWDLRFDVTIKLMTNPEEVWQTVNSISVYDYQIISLMKKCLNPDPLQRPTIDQILKKKVVKKHLKYLEKTKQQYKKSQIAINSDDQESYYSKQISSNSSYIDSDELGLSEMSVPVEDQGCLKSDPIGSKNKKKTKKKNKRANKDLSR